MSYLSLKTAYTVLNTLCASSTFPESWRVVDLDGTDGSGSTIIICEGTQSGGK